MFKFIFIILLVAIIFMLFGVLMYLIFVKISRNGETEFEGEVSVLKILYIKLKTRHTSNKK